jgi:hypothetical protein
MVSFSLFIDSLVTLFIVHHSQEISGRLQTIELNVIAQDYQIIMQILENNMKEGQNEFKKPKRGRPIQPATPRQDETKGKLYFYS